VCRFLNGKLYAIVMAIKDIHVSNDISKGICRYSISREQRTGKEGQIRYNEDHLTKLYDIHDHTNEGAEEREGVLDSILLFFPVWQGSFVWSALLRHNLLFSGGLFKNK